MATFTTATNLETQANPFAGTVLMQAMFAFSAAECINQIQNQSMMLPPFSCPIHQEDGQQELRRTPRISPFSSI
jgi:hypothetical protein